MTGLTRMAAILVVGTFASPAFGQMTVPNVAPPTARSSTVPVPQPAPAPGRPAPSTASSQLLNSTENAIDQQSRGQFPTMERGPSLPLGTLQRGWDRPMPAAGQTAPGVVHYMWHPDFVMSVRTRDFMVTTLLLPPWERANEFYLGDPVVFEAKRVRSNVVAVRSRNAGADSNLTILGASGNVYNFYLRSETWNSTQVSDLTVYVDAPRVGPDGETGDQPASGGVFDGGGLAADPTGATATPGIPDYLRRVIVRPEDLRFDMRMFARRETDAEIAPERVFEDGTFTYFDFGDHSDAIGRPVVHHLVDGVDTVVNTRTAGPRGSILIAEAVGDFTLRNGNRVVCVRQVAPRQLPAAVEVGTAIPEPGSPGIALPSAARNVRISPSGKER